ncbi:hypothetical protein DFH28DRAFT_960587 [Melampsora americana]|nr:hypothetical protein DFH28DRAFT_960587 [Melampsora americana]
MGWSPWSYVSLSKTLVNQTQTLEIDPIQTSHQTKEPQSNLNQKDKMRFQGLKIFKKSTHQEDKSTIPTTSTTPPTPTPIRRKLKKSRPIPKLKPKKEKQFKNLSIKVIPNSQSEAQSIIQSTYSNIISNTNFNTNHLFLNHDHDHQFNSSQPKLISLQSAQQAQICNSSTNTTNTDHKELIGIAT